MRNLLTVSIFCFVLWTPAVFADASLKINNSVVVSSTGSISYNGYRSIVKYIDNFAGEYGFEKFVTLAFHVVTQTDPPKKNGPAVQLKETQILKDLVTEMKQIEVMQKLEAVRELVKDATSIIEAIPDQETKTIAENAFKALQESKVPKHENPEDVFDSIIGSATEPNGANQ